MAAAFLSVEGIVAVKHLAKGKPTETEPTVHRPAEISPAPAEPSLPATPTASPIVVVGPSVEPASITEPTAAETVIAEDIAVAEPEDAPTATPVVSAAKDVDEIQPVQSKPVKSKPAKNKLIVDDSKLIAQGLMLFEHEWVPHDPLSGKGDGLGPTFNGRSCVECHFQAGTGGSGTNAHNVQTYEVLPDRNFGPTRDGVIHSFATNSMPESLDLLHTKLDSPTIPATHEPTAQVTMLDAIRTVYVNTPALWGDGLIDQITDDDLRNIERRPETRGRLRQLDDGRIGKFGWKSQMSSLSDFVAGACAGELGLTNSDRAQQVLFKEDRKAKPDMTPVQLAALVKYVSSLPAPQQVIPVDVAGRQNVAQGHKVFARIGCATCHVENVGPAKGVYSDFRLHMVASRSLKDDRYYSPEYTPIYRPKPSYPKLTEWKTPPLWGLANTAPYWHDGSAATIQDAILKHELDAQSVVSSYRNLGKQDQDSLIAFLKSLKAPGMAPADNPQQPLQNAKVASLF